VTEYKTIKYYEGWTLAEAYPKTGRTHQIRVHFKALGHPVYGDELYSKTGPGEKYGRLFLHAKNIEFTAPNGSRMKIEADIPEDLARILQTLKEYDKN
jgi:23S rRNA-/tRNA-specific pseudouridylate synthase